MTEEFAQFVDQYVALWNEPDTDARRNAIEQLWAADGANYTASMEAVGYDALERRVTAAYEAYVGSGQYRFRSAEPAVEHHHAAKVRWEMVTVPDGDVASVGLEFLVLDDDGRIVSDHQFIVS